VFRAEPLASGAFYVLKRRGRTMAIVMNTRHPLHRVLYEPSKRRRDPLEVRIVERMIAAAARAELQGRTKAERKVLEQHRNAWGDALAAFLGIA
jgi:hypothetical protein